MQVTLKLHKMSSETTGNVQGFIQVGHFIRPPTTAAD